MSLLYFGRKYRCKPQFTPLLCKLLAKAADTVAKKFAGKSAGFIACGEEGLETAGVCEAVGIGPEDPLADICAVGLGYAVDRACRMAAKDGVGLSAKFILERVGCSSS